jgi:hypothetical protein
MNRRFGPFVAVIVVIGTIAYAQTIDHSNEASASTRKSVTHIAVNYDQSYDSIFVLRAATKDAVIATVKSVAPDPSTTPSRPGSLVTMAVSQVLRGSPGRRIVVSGLGGQPGDGVVGQIPLRVGRAYLMLLGEDPQTGRYFVLNGITGLFGYDSMTQVASRLDPRVTSIPGSVALTLVEGQLGAPILEPPAPHDSPPLAGDCPPGCSLPSDFDALTVLASSSNLVALITVTNKRTGASVLSYGSKIDTILQGNPHHLTVPRYSCDFADNGQMNVTAR